MVKAIREIPSTMDVIDADGKVSTKPMAWKILPPQQDACQICAVKHAPEQPHNAQSLYYQMTFNAMIGRPPTWADAVAHCSDVVQNGWRRGLDEMGVWSEPPNGEKPVKHHGVE